MEKEVRYIQLPPIPEDIEMPALEAIWLFARMSLEEKRDAIKQIEAVLGNETENGKPDYETMQEILDKYGQVEDEPIFLQYIESFRKVLSDLIIESYDMAAYVYQKRCVEGLSIDEIMKGTNISKDTLNIFVKYFDVRYNDFSDRESGMFH